MVVKIHPLLNNDKLTFICINIFKTSYYRFFISNLPAKFIDMAIVVKK